ncbi:MAG: chromosome segregation protein SMC [Lachnospiraceae bacterium]|nr:chromosome segregation protein SMC [Candidatus Minthocola equi]
MSVTEREKSETEEKLASAVSDYQVINTKLEALTNMAERYDGYGDSIRQVMTQKKGNKAIRGVVADLISVDKKYETAIETALGTRIQNVVTEDEATAKAMVEFLKKNKFGRVTFLPMDAVKATGFQNPEALTEEGAIDTADKLVKAESQYNEVVKYLLGRVLVVDAIDHALAIARKFKYKLHIVTIEGEYLSPGGSITGGAFKNNSNLLGRRREMDELEKLLAQAKESGEKLRDKAQGYASELAHKKADLATLMQELQELRIKYAQGESQLQSIRDDRARLADEKDAKLREQNDLLLMITELNAQIVDSKQAELEAEKVEENRKKAAEKLVEQLDAERELYKKMTEELNQLRMEFSKLEERDNFLMETFDSIDEELERITDEKKELLSKADPEGMQVLARKREIEKIQKHLDELTAEATELSSAIGAAVSARDNFAEEQKALLDGRDEKTAMAASLDKDMVRLTNQEERITEAIDTQISYLWNEYEMTPAEAEAQKFEGSESITEIRKIIAAHKDEIRALGPVNVNAIEQEKEMGERYEFLSAQFTDLTKARDDIMAVIKDLESGMRTQFEENFAKIKEEFDKVFKELFGGGKGTLELVADEDGDILKSGIAIIAQPPGKKLQNMMQLSGGEKALTAIALIFAIQNLKPSPFCLVDEIEAALDERNVDRFAGYLKKLKEHTQIIAITHRRGTMEAAEILYGITMQERGVSTLVSVDLTDPDIVED